MIVYFISSDCSFDYIICICSVAVEVESIIRKQGAVPATIGAVDGEMIVGGCKSRYSAKD